MNTLIPVVQTGPAALPATHGFGEVADDWPAAQVWAGAIASRGRRNSPVTVVTYG